MQIVYDPLPEAEKEAFKRFHSRGYEIVRAIETDLSHDPLTRAAKLTAGRYSQIFIPEINPPLEVRISYLVGDKILIKVFKWTVI